MNFGIRREEAEFLRDLITFERMEFGDVRLKEVYGNIDLEGMLRQLEIIIMIGDSVKDEEVKW